MKTRIVHTKIWDDGWFAELPRSSKLVFLFLLTCKENNICGAFEMSDRVICFNTQITQAELDQAKKDIEEKAVFFDGWVRLLNIDKYNNYRFSEKNEKAFNREVELMPEHVRQVFNLKFTIDEFREKRYQKSGGKYVHRKIAEKFLGRRLLKNEVVHHIDKNPENNHPSNLAVMDTEEHRLLHQGKINIKDTSMILVSKKKTLVINHKSEIRNQKSNKKGGVGGNKPTKIQMDEIAQKYQVPFSFVESKWDDVENYCLSTGKKYKDYLATLRNWVKKDALKIKQGNIYADKKRAIDATEILRRMGG